MSKAEISLCGSSSRLRRCFKCGSNFYVDCKFHGIVTLSCNDNKKLCPNNVEDAKLNGWHQLHVCQHMVERSYESITCPG